ncbi:hypothetical protein GEMRC1_009087 [Eukaryota sp. GEM-RC1]
MPKNSTFCIQNKGQTVDKNVRPTHYTRPKAGRTKALRRNSRKMARLHRAWEIDEEVNVHLDDFHRAINWDERPGAKLEVHGKDGEVIFSARDSRHGLPRAPTSD